MAPSHSTPEQVSKTIQQIIFLIDTIDNKALLAYHEYVARNIRARTSVSELDVEYDLLAHIFAFKVVLQNRRRELKKEGK